MSVRLLLIFSIHRSFALIVIWKENVLLPFRFYFVRQLEPIKYLVLSLFRFFTLRFPFSKQTRLDIIKQSAAPAPLSLSLSLWLLSPGLSPAQAVITRTKKKLSACLISPIGADPLMTRADVLFHPRTKASLITLTHM